MKRRNNSKSTKKVPSFEKLVIKKMNSRYYSLSSENKRIIHEISKCQEQGEIGKRVIDEDN